MAKGKIKDFLSAAFENGGQYLLESGITEDAIVELGTSVVEEGTALALGSIISACAPRLNGIRLSYRANRFERNVNAALELINYKIQEFDSRIYDLNEEMQEKFRGLYVEWFLDNLYEEKQTDKVKYHVNGFINMMDLSTTDDLMLIFMETLNQLTVLDIDVLKMYSLEHEINFNDICSSHNISFQQVDMIKAKLERHGLLYSRNDDQRDKNIDIIVDYIHKRVKEEAKKNGNTKNIRLAKTNKINRSESYSITPLGREFLRKVS